MEKKAGPKWKWYHLPWIAFCALGISSVSDFPFLLYNHGGGAFLIIYLALTILVTSPILYTLLRVGGRSYRDAVSFLGRYLPIAKGVGIAVLIHGSVYSVYHQVPLGQLLWYMIRIALGHGDPEWSRCDNSWNTAACWQLQSQNFSTEYSNEYPELEYYHHELLKQSKEYSSLGAVVWDQAWPLALVWVFTLLLVAGGPRFFAWLISACGVLLVVVICLLLGHAYGLQDYQHARLGWKTFFEIDWTVVKDVKVWQIAWRSGMFTNLIWIALLPSVGKFNSKRYKATSLTWLPLMFVVAVIPNVLVNLVAGYMGLLAHSQDVNVDSISQTDYRFLFIGIPQLISKLQLGVYWSLTLFSLPFLLGTMQQAMIVLVVCECISHQVNTSGLRDSLPRKFLTRILISSIFCTLGFLLGLIAITEGGIYIVILLDKSVHRLNFVYFALFMTVFCIACIRFRKLGRERYVIVVLCSLSSIAALFLWVYNEDIGAALTYENLDHDIVEYPNSGEILGWFISACPLVLGVLAGVLHSSVLAHRTGGASYLLRGQSSLKQQTTPEADDRGAESVISDVTRAGSRSGALSDAASSILTDGAVTPDASVFSGASTARTETTLVSDRS